MTTTTDLAGHPETHSKPSYEELLEALRELAVNTDEDCPAEYRSSHLSNALADAFDLIERANPDQAKG